jgi:5-methylcytosine-specific restriction protein A
LPRRDDRSPEAQAYRSLYKTAAWRKRRAAQLAEHPLCWMCEQQGIMKAATVADHVKPHRGDRALFDGPLRSLCDTHHSATKQREENLGRSIGVGVDGWPIT